MSDPGLPPDGSDLPPRGGAHRGSSSRARQSVLALSLLGVVLVGVGVGYALHQSGENSHTGASSPRPSTPSTTLPATSTAPASTASTSAPATASGSSAAPAGTASPLPSQPAPSTTQASPAAARPALDVLNNSRITGLAARAAQQFRDGGWVVASTGNYTGRLSETTVYYPSGDQGAAQQLARQYPQIHRVEPAPAGFSASQLTVVLTKDWVDS